MTVRADLAAAASTVEGVTAHPYFKQGSHPGHTFVRIARIDYPNFTGGVVRWDLLVVLPADAAEAEKYLETKIPLVREAVAEHLVVTEVVPQRVRFSDTLELTCAVLSGHREE